MFFSDSLYTFLCPLRYTPLKGGVCNVTQVLDTITVTLRNAFSYIMLYNVTLLKSETIK